MDRAQPAARRLIRDAVYPDAIKKHYGWATQPKNVAIMKISVAGLALSAWCPPLIMQHLPLTVGDPARRMECWRMHEIRLRCPRREHLVPDRDRSRSRQRIRRHAPCRRKVFPQGARKGDPDLSPVIQGAL